MNKSSITLVLCSFLASCAASPSSTECLPVIVKGKLIVDKTVVIPPCGIIIDQPALSTGAP